MSFTINKAFAISFNVSCVVKSLILLFLLLGKESSKITEDGLPNGGCSDDGMKSILNTYSSKCTLLCLVIQTSVTEWNFCLALAPVVALLIICVCSKSFENLGFLLQSLSLSRL